MPKDSLSGEIHPYGYPGKGTSTFVFISVFCEKKLVTALHWLQIISLDIWWSTIIRNPKFWHKRSKLEANFFLLKPISCSNSFKLNIGKSIYEDNCDQIIEQIFSLSKKESCKIIYPEDVSVGKDLNGSPLIKEVNKVTEDELILDIGPKTIQSIKNIIEKSKTILWNGPAGYFENPNYAKGSLEIAKKIIEKNKTNTIYSVAGGGDTVALLNSIGAIKNFNFVSTAGGAFLEYLEGKKLPGIRALN